MKDFNDAVILLLLQITLYRQQELSHQDSSLEVDKLLLDPKVDQTILNKFISHKMTKLYTPELTNINLRSLKMLLTDVLDQTELDGEKNLITLANYYYSKRVSFLEEEKLPGLVAQIRQEIDSQSKAHS